MIGSESGYAGSEPLGSRRAPAERGPVVLDLARSQTPPISLEELSSAIATLPHGGTDDATRDFKLPAPVRSTVSPILSALRWGAVMLGVVFAAPDANDGDLQVVLSLSIALFFTSWRSFRPNRLASSRPIDRALVLTDAMIIGAAAGASGGLESPFSFCALVAVFVAAFGWGLRVGLAALGCTFTTALAVGLVTTDAPLLGEAGLLTSRGALTVLALMAASVVIAAFARDRLLDAESRRMVLTGQVNALAETNDLLHLLNEVARTLPTSLDLREAVDGTRIQLTRAFGPEVLCLLVYDDTSDEWSPQIADGCVLSPSSTTSQLPAPLRRTISAGRPTLEAESVAGETISTRSRSGMYTVLRSRGHVVGTLALEHSEPNHYTSRDLRVLEGLADVLALTVDNARWFGRLRALGADEERSRIARDLHDRLGQWLTYISFELERIIAGTESHEELDRLQSDVQQAIDELRETLRQLRSGVTEDQPLSRVANDLVDRFEERTEVDVAFRVINPRERLAVPIENELLRILQEALSNIDKHAKARRVDVSWEVKPSGTGTLRISDDGVGFDLRNGIRESAYGLVGMRERAAVIGARLTVESEPDSGTTITVVAGTSTQGAKP